MLCTSKYALASLMTGSLKCSEGQRGTAVGERTNYKEEGAGAGVVMPGGGRGGAGIVMPGGGGGRGDGTATGGLFGARKDMVRSDAKEAERSS